MTLDFLVIRVIFISYEYLAIFKDMICQTSEEKLLYLFIVNLRVVLC